MNDIPAFPVLIVDRPKELIQLPVDLRDYFAAKAMQALIDNDGLFVVIPTQAYAIADAMMAARNTK